MHVDQVWRYPVKSMIGERVPAAKVGQMGMSGDRWWAARDEVRGGIRGAKKIAELMQLGARFVDEVGGPVEITLPDGSTVRTDDDDRDARVSAALDHEVTLWPLRPPTDLDHYRRGPADSDDIMEELRADLRPRDRRAAARPVGVPAGDPRVRVAPGHLRRRLPAAADDDVRV